MPVRLEDVLPAVVVKIDEVDSPADELRVGGQARSHAYIFEEEPFVVAIQVGIIVSEVRLYQVQPAVPVEITHSDAHAALLESVLVERDAGLGGVIGERAVAVIDEQDAGGGVASDVDVLPAIPVEVRSRSGEGIVFTHVANARGLADILESPVPAIAVQRDSAERESARPAVHRHPLPFAVGRLPGRRRRIQIELLVLRHEQVKEAVPVVVHERASGTPLRCRTGHASCLRDLREGAVAVIAVQSVGSPIRDEDVDGPVVVVVARANGAAPARAPDAATGRDVLKPAAAKVAIQPAQWFTVGSEAFQPGAVRKEGIEPGVAVVVKQRDARAVGLDDVALLVRIAVGEFQIETGLRGHVSECRVPRQTGCLQGLDRLGV